MNVGFFLVLISALLLSFKGILIKLMYQEGASVMAVMLWRFGLALPLFWFGYFYMYRGVKTLRLISPKIWIITLIAGFFGYYLAPVLDLMALERIPVNVERVILFTYPAMVLLLNSYLSRTFPKKGEMLSFIVAQIGLFLLVMGDEDQLKMTLDGLGVLLALVSAFLFAVYILLNQKSTKELKAVEFTAIAISSAFFFTLAHVLGFAEFKELTLSTNAMIYVGLMSVFCTFIPLVLFTEGVRRLGGVKTALVSGIGPFFTAWIAYVILDETLTHFQIIGSILIIAGVLLINIGGKKK